MFRVLGIAPVLGQLGIYSHGFVIMSILKRLRPEKPPEPPSESKAPTIAQKLHLAKTWPVLWEEDGSRHHSSCTRRQYEHHVEYEDHFTMAWGAHWSKKMWMRENRCFPWEDGTETEDEDSSNENIDGIMDRAMKGIARGFRK